MQSEVDDFREDFDDDFRALPPVRVLELVVRADFVLVLTLSYDAPLSLPELVLGDG